jgi:hypothetical protein
VSSQLAIGRLKLRYLLIARFIHKRFCSGCARCAPNDQAEPSARSKTIK